MKTNKKVLIIALIFAALATTLVFRYLNVIKPVNSTKDNLVQIFVAKENIPANTKIQNNMIEKKEIQINYSLPNVVKDSSLIIGKYSLTDIYKQELILSNQLIDLEQTYFSFQIPQGKRAITVKVNDVAGVAHMIKPGDYVDVLVFTPLMEDKTTNKKYTDMSNTILQNILVLAINQDYRPIQNTENENEEVEKSLDKNITIAVNPIEAEKLLLIDEIGNIRLALRNSSDNKINTTSGAIRENSIIKNR